LIATLVRESGDCYSGIEWPLKCEPIGMFGHFRNKLSHYLQEQLEIKGKKLKEKQEAEKQRLEEAERHRLQQMELKKK